MFKRMIVTACLSGLIVCFIAGCSSNGHTPLHQAAIKGDLKQVESLLKKEGTDVNAKNDFGRTPLHEAAIEGHPEVAAALIKAGADVNAANANGVTPLHCAASEKSTRMVAVLLDAGADVHAQNVMGCVPLDTAGSLGYADVAIMLVAAGSDMNRKGTHGRTLLHHAVSQGNANGYGANVVRLLIMLGANPNITDSNNETPQQVARKIGNAKVADEIAEAIETICNIRYTPVEREDEAM